MLLESYLGVQVHDFKLVNAVFDENAAKISQTYKPIINTTKQLLDISTRSDTLKTRTEELILQFANHPKQVSSQLILFQELCLSSNILPDENILDLSPDITHLLDQLDPSDQRMLLVQSLTFCWLRDGEIASSAKILEESKEAVVVDPQEESKGASGEEKDYLKYLIKMRRLKPSMIDSAQTHKDLFTAKLVSLKYPNMYLGQLQKQPDNPKDRAYLGLDQLIKLRQESLIYAQKDLMKEPLSLISNLKFIQGLMYNSRIKDAQKAYALLQKKIDSGMITMDQASDQDRESLADLDLILNQDSASQSKSKVIPDSLAQLATQKKLKIESEDPDEFTT